MKAGYKYDILETHAYDVGISRKDEEIKMDPFVLGNTVKGLTNMDHEKNLSNYAEELVANFAKFSVDHYELYLDMLPEYEKNELVRLYIEATDRDLSECIYGDDLSINSEFTCALLSMLRDDCLDNRERFAEVTRTNVITYFENPLHKYLEHACNLYLILANNENGYYAHTSQESGEIFWSKH